MCTREILKVRKRYPNAKILCTRKRYPKWHKLISRKYGSRTAVKMINTRVVYLWKTKKMFLKDLT